MSHVLFFSILNHKMTNTKTAQFEIRIGFRSEESGKHPIKGLAV